MPKNEHLHWDPPGKSTGFAGTADCEWGRYAFVPVEAGWQATFDCRCCHEHLVLFEGRSKSKAWHAVHDHYRAVCNRVRPRLRALPAP